jgi:hypothetical protein
MAPEEESKPATSQPEVGPRTAGRRDRRPSRGRRGRGRGARPKPTGTEPPETPRAEQDSVQEPEPIFELAEEASQPPETHTGSIERHDRSSVESQSSAPLHPPHQPASVASIEKAIEEVSAVVEALRTSLEEMEEVLELLEVFERQKTADEREIESLRRAVRQMHRPRDAGHHPHR